MTLQDLALALQARRSSANELAGKAASVPDEKLVSFYTRCGRCGKPLFMDDSLIVEQSASVDKFLDRCARRLFEHSCDSGSKPQI